MQVLQHFFEKEIIIEERVGGSDGHKPGIYQKRWNNRDYHEDGGESIAMVQKRNIEDFIRESR